MYEPFVIIPPAFGEEVRIGSIIQRVMPLVYIALAATHYVAEAG